MIRGVPYDAEIEYLESTGTQYIDTGYVPNSTTAFELSVAYTGNGGQFNRLFGTQKDEAGKTLTIQSSDGQGVSFFVESAWGAAYGTFDTNKHTFSFSDGAAYVDGVMLFSNHPPSNQITGSAWLWGTNNVGYHARAKIYLCKLQDGATLVRDFIPVRVGTTGYLYDRVSKKLFGNLGTGDFVLGPDKSIPLIGLHFYPKPKPTAKDYVQNGLVAMWDGIENAGWGVHDPNATMWKDLVGSYDGTVGANVVVMDNCMSFNGTKGEANAVKVGKVTFGSPQFVTFEAVFIKDHDAEVSVINEAVFGQTESRTSMVTMFVKSRLEINYKKLGDSASSDIRYGSAPFGMREMMSASFRYASDEIQLFKDGVVVASKTNDSTPIDMSSASYNFYIGGDAYSPEEYTLLGRVFNLRIYSRALTADEIARNYAIDKERFNLK